MRQHLSCPSGPWTHSSPWTCSLSSSVSYVALMAYLTTGPGSPVFLWTPFSVLLTILPKVPPSFQSSLQCPCLNISKVKDVEKSHGRLTLALASPGRRCSQHKFNGVVVNFSKIIFAHNSPTLAPNSSRHQTPTLANSVFVRFSMPIYIPVFTYVGTPTTHPHDLGW